MQSLWKGSDRRERRKGRSVGSVERRSVGERKAFVFVNNRLEGSALATIAAVLDGARTIE